MTNKTTEERAVTGAQNDEILKAQEELRQREERVSKKIEAALLEEKMALQPFMVYTEYGTAPRVRLVDISDQENDEQTDSEGDATADRESNGTAEPVKS
jgi:hypothetical protein